MTRKILCKQCLDELKAIVQKYPDEELISMPGTAQRDFNCDDCGVSIALGQPCFAVTIISAQMRYPYQPWETQFINFYTQ